VAKRRSRGDGGLHWDERRQRWIATASLGYRPDGKRVVKRASGRTKTEAKAKLREILRDQEDGLATGPGDYTVADAVSEWLKYGLAGRDDKTRKTNEHLCEAHVLPFLGSSRLRELSAQDVDRWLADRAAHLSDSSLRKVHSALSRAINQAMARDKVKRNVAALCRIPRGRRGRPSKALTLAQARAVLAAARDSPMYAYVVLLLLTGARTEELRALTWDHVDLLGRPDTQPPIPPHIAVWRSVRAQGETKTRKSRRTIALPIRCVDVLSELRRQQVTRSGGVGPNGLVFSTATGGPMDAANVRRAFRSAIARAEGVTARQWTPRELRHSFVSLLSDHGVPVEEIARLVRHSSTTTTEPVYRKQIRPVIQTGAVVLDAVFGSDRDSHADRHAAVVEPDVSGDGHARDQGL
jgi:integrase